jgi:hypothetical protein
MENMNNKINSKTTSSNLTTNSSAVSTIAQTPTNGKTAVEKAITPYL